MQKRKDLIEPNPKPTPTIKVRMTRRFYDWSYDFIPPKVDLSTFNKWVEKSVPESSMSSVMISLETETYSFYDDGRVETYLEISWMEDRPDPQYAKKLLAWEKRQAKSLRREQ